MRARLPGGRPGTHGYDRTLYEELEYEARELLRKLAWRVKVAGGEVAGAHLRMGEVDLEIVGLAKRLGADLIRHALCLVLVVPPSKTAQTPERAALLQGSR